MSRLARAPIALALGLLVVCSCQAPTQRVPLVLGPAGVRVFVDGVEAIGPPESLELRSDRPHVIHVERDGYSSQQVILEARRTASGPRLEPAEVRLQLAPVVPTNQQIRIHGVGETEL